MHLVQDLQRMKAEGPRPGQVWSLNGHVVVVMAIGDRVARCAATHDRPRLAGPGDLVNDLVACPALDYPVPLHWFQHMEPLRDLGTPRPTGACRHWRLVHKILRENFAEVLEDYFTWYDENYAGDH